MTARAYIAIPIPPRSAWQLLADPDDCPPGFMIIGTAAVRHRHRLPVQTSAHAVRALPASSEPTPRTLCAACPLRQAPAQEARRA
jgi:hypothetical protein